ncbi:MAG: hypothetical protein D6708_05445 [Candidatus Dadabacteria bacterium]|nr:MAG: hypothetical protein D6708_05445 [Candidatus Dadabacteria bacterium]
MARSKTPDAQRAEPRPGSALLNKVKLAVAMGIGGLAAAFAVRGLAPAYTGLVLLLMAVGVLSALTAAGPTFDARCPACGRAIAFTRALGQRVVPCRRCGAKLAVERRGGETILRRTS